MIFSFLFLVFLYLYRLPQSFFIDTDYARDLYEIAKIAKGTLTLIGPVLRIGLFAGPYYYYLFTPSMLLSHYSSDWILYTNAGFFIVSLFIGFYLLAKKIGQSIAILVTLLVGTIPAFLTSARHPGNAYTYLGPLLVYIIWGYFYPPINKFKILIFGIFAGILINFHPATLFVIIPLFFYQLFKNKSYKNIFIWLSGLSLTFAPIFLFELRHNFVILKGLFIIGNYKYFTSSEYLGSVAVFRMFWQLTGPILLFTLLLIFRPRLLKKPLIVMNIFSFLLAIILLKFKVAPYYLLPVALLMVFSLGVELLKSYGKWLFVPMMAANLLFFPVQIYSPSTRSIDFSQKLVADILREKIIVPSDTFNIFHIPDIADQVPMGHEFRFAFLRLNIRPLPEYDFTSAQKLLIISEIGEVDLGHLSNWETDQFGLENLKKYKKFTFGSTVVYLVEKH